MFRKSIVVITALALAIVGVGLMTAQDKTGKDPKRDADRAAIDKLAKEMTQAFNNRDAAALAANWTDEAEYIRNDGAPVRGRAEIQKGYADFFKALKGKFVVELQYDALRFLSPDSAITEVTLRLKNDEGEAIGSSWRNTLLVREGGQWKVAMVREWDRDISLDTSLKELEWLIGTWQASSKDREVTTSYQWDENKTFILGKYSVKEGTKVIESGKQIIGKDNAQGVIRSWVFQADGGFGGGVWTREGKKWSVEVYGATSEGHELTATTIYVHLDPNTYTWQAVSQTVNGEPVADTAPIKVSKQK